MNFELFIAKRIIAGKEHKSSISSPIIKIATIAIALGIAIMLISVSIASGFQKKIRDKMSGFKGHIQIVNYDNNNSDLSTVPIDKNQDFYPEFKNIDGIKNVQVFANVGGIIRTPTDFEGIIFKGVSSDYDFSFFKEYLKEGRLPNFNQSRNKEILISESIANRLNFKLNDTIETLFSSEKSKLKHKRRKPVIVGIYNTGLEQFDKSILIGDIREVQRINSWSDNQIGGFEVVIDDFDMLAEKGDEVYFNVGATLNSSTIVESNPLIFDWIKLFDNNVRFIIAIMILIAGINMITALLVLILERVKMIGILKALGSVNWSIRKIFLYNAFYLILKGLFWGNIIGVTLLFIQKYFKPITLDPETYHVSSVPVEISFWVILLLNIGALILCFFMLIVPSYIVTKIHPSKSIRFA
ncbi:MULTISPECIES: ABC transporter permease [unclassified Tenacibaculum]|uniref:ABC transporter permease n=1 Tax=unclassified Tenacibaculum TaxID=2635139 RepID=UPI001F38C29B|nr:MULTISPECIES: FtsX-like permease family protein [unclassified Tenacibaculum]MCF2875016.1 ABC transporter permease [Tenacibaculum sp. Cn5-1]MCF2935092.1 ABC transporter permease [Tenacibaculum sp. Cn5-34]MCG7511466.1 ABC transporter permease [Tenacibaculum sp. Cn5-46]